MVEPRLDLSFVLMIALGSIFFLALLALGISYQSRKKLDAHADKPFHSGGCVPGELPGPPYANRDLWAMTPRVRPAGRYTIETRTNEPNRENDA